MYKSERKFAFFMRDGKSGRKGLMPDFIRMKTGRFEKFCPIIKWRFLENHIRPHNYIREVLAHVVEMAAGRRCGQ